jgi:hypothetical protein
MKAKMTRDRNRFTETAQDGCGEDEVTLNQTPHPCAEPGSLVGRGPADHVVFVDVAAPTTPWFALLRLAAAVEVEVHDVHRVQQAVQAVLELVAHHSHGVPVMHEPSERRGLAPTEMLHDQLHGLVVDALPVEGGEPPEDDYVRTDPEVLVDTGDGAHARSQGQGGLVRVGHHTHVVPSGDVVILIPTVVAGVGEPPVDVVDVDRTAHPLRLDDNARPRHDATHVLLLSKTRSLER